MCADGQSLPDELRARYRGCGRDALIPLLQDIQQRAGYLSVDAMAAAARLLGVPAAEVHGVASFYAQFRFRPAGRVLLRVCTGTACHVAGAGEIVAAIEAKLGISRGDTTADGMFTLDTVACLGCCSLAPVLMAGGEVHGRLTPEQVPALLQRLRGSANG